MLGIYLLASGLDNTLYLVGYLMVMSVTISKRSIFMKAIKGVLRG